MPDQPRADSGSAPGHAASDARPDEQTTPGSAAGGGEGSGRTVAWFHCFSGIAGDMALGALIDAGASLDEVERWCRRLGVGGWELRAERVLRGGIAGTRLLVDVDEAHRHPHRRAVDVDELITAAGLPARVEARALATFRLLAEVEGRLHGVAPD